MAIPTAYASFHTLESLLLLLISLTAPANTWLTFCVIALICRGEVARGIKLECKWVRDCVCVCLHSCVCVCVRNEKQQKSQRSVSLWRGSHFLQPQDFIFISKESFKNDLLYNLNLFIHVPSTWASCERQYWLLNEWGDRERKCVATELERWRGRMPHLWDTKNYGAISVSRCWYLNEHPITQVVVSLRRGTRAPN